MFALSLFHSGALAWAPTHMAGMYAPLAAPRTRAAVLQTAAEAASEKSMFMQDIVDEAEGVVHQTDVIDGNDWKINQAIGKSSDTKAVLKLVGKYDNMNALNVATALHRLARINKRARAGRDALVRDKNFEKLVDATIVHASDFNARMVSDVLWSFATLQHWPPTLLKPLLTAVATLLQTDKFEAPHLSTTAWALAKLECKPVRLLEQIEEKAVPRLGLMNVQNCANLLWGFAKLNYNPKVLMPALSETLLAPGFLNTAKAVEISDLAFAVGQIGGAAPAAEHVQLLHALAARAGPDAEPRPADFSSRQLVILVWVSGQRPEGTVHCGFACWQLGCVSWVNVTAGGKQADHHRYSQCTSEDRCLLERGRLTPRQSAPKPHAASLGALREGGRRHTHTLPFICSPAAASRAFTAGPPSLYLLAPRNAASHTVAARVF